MELGNEARRIEKGESQNIQYNTDFFYYDYRNRNPIKLRLG